MDNSVRIARDDAAGMTNLTQYIIRSPFSISTAEEFIATITSRTAMVGMAETVPPNNPSQPELFDDGWPGYEEPYITYV